MCDRSFDNVEGVERHMQVDYLESEARHLLEEIMFRKSTEDTQDFTLKNTRQYSHKSLVICSAKLFTKFFFSKNSLKWNFAFAISPPDCIKTFKNCKVTYLEIKEIS